MKKNKGVLIGPSKCDEGRKQKEKEIDEIWSTLTNNEGFKEAYPLFGPAFDLFREALSCYQNGAFMATVLMCRSVTEVLVYLVATRDIKEILKNGIGEIEMNIELCDAKFGELLKKAKEKLPVIRELECKINKIREKGNFVAHYGQRLDKKLKEDVSVEVEIWITKEDALDILKKTACILNETMNEVMKLYLV
jgi:hypothetical protein